jgi:hypothetical protein
MTATDAQVRIVMRERRKGKTQEQAAAKANLDSRKTVWKYEKLGELPSELKKPRVYRTREDPFEEDWGQVEAMLKDAPELEAKMLFEWLSEEKPDKYQEGQLRTLQRRVSTWRALNGEELLMLEQIHIPGEVMQTDGTWMNELGISIQGQAFAHMLIHSVLPYSNWEWGRVVQTESLLAIRLGVQSSLVKLGYVPKIHQTDNSTAATHHLGPENRDQQGAERDFNEEYLQLMAHFGIEPRTIHLDSPDENGDIEAANGAFKKAVEQHLLLRGSRDFESLAAYEAFLWQIMEKRNALRSEKLAEELAVMRPLTVEPWPAMRELRPKVNRAGLIRVGNNGYSVPSGLKGKQVSVRIFEWQIEVWFAGKCVESMSRLTGVQKYRINYRHVIDTLLRKPGGFRNYRYREEIFPSSTFRAAWEYLNQRYTPRNADLAFLRILKLAAGGLESDVEAVLAELLSTKTVWNDQTVATRVQPVSVQIPVLEAPLVNLDEYDQLLSLEVCYDYA